MAGVASQFKRKNSIRSSLRKVRDRWRLPESGTRTTAVVTPAGDNPCFAAHAPNSTVNNSGGVGAADSVTGEFSSKYEVKRKPKKQRRNNDASGIVNPAFEDFVACDVRREDVILKAVTNTGDANVNSEGSARRKRRSVRFEDEENDFRERREDEDESGRKQFCSDNNGVEFNKKQFEDCDEFQIYENVNYKRQRLVNRNYYNSAFNRQPSDVTTEELVRRNYELLTRRRSDILEKIEEISYEEEAFSESEAANEDDEDSSFAPSVLSLPVVSLYTPPTGQEEEKMPSTEFGPPKRKRPRTTGPDKENVRNGAPVLDRDRLSRIVKRLGPEVLCTIGDDESVLAQFVKTQERLTAEQCSGDQSHRPRKRKLPAENIYGNVCLLSVECLR